MPRHKQSDPTSIKTQVIRLRATGAEAEKFSSKAAESGCKTVSEYIRFKCIGENTVDTTADTPQDTLKKKQAKPTKK